jgi:type IV secretory pathway ATPase VirB11/archaellum biosynthesis ATPase
MSTDNNEYLRQRVARLEEQWLGQNPLVSTITPDGTRLGVTFKSPTAPKRIQP